MNRNREYNELLRALDETPPELEYTVTRAKARAAGRRQWLGWLSVPVGTLAAVSLAFVMLVNSNVAFAQTVAEVPLLNELAAAVDWSGSLSAAVEHNYVQVIGQSQTKNGITVTVDHVIVDQQQVNLFITTENQDEEFPYSWLRWNVLSEAGECSMLSYGEDENGTLRRITIDFHGRSQVPETLTMAFSVWPFRDYEELDPLPEQESAANFVFTIRFDPTYTANGETFPIGQWVQLDGQSSTFQNSFYLNNYPYDSVMLTLDYTQWEIFGQPIAVSIQ